MGVPARLAAQGGRFVGALRESLEGQIGGTVCVAILSCKMCTSPYTVWHFVEFESNIGSDRLAKSKPVLRPFDDFSKNEDLRVTFDCILMGQQKSRHAVA